LRRVGGRDRNHPHAGAFRLAVQDVQELAPANIVSGLRQPRARDALNIQRLMRYHAVLAYELARDLVVEVASLVGDLQVLLGESLHRFLAPIAPLPLASHRALRTPERLLRLTVVARRGDLTSIRCHQESFQPKINPGGW